MMLMGFMGFALGTYVASGITVDWDFYELLVPQILRGCSLMICMVPINNLSLGTLAPDQLKNASGLFNLTRNLGGAVGLAVINTVLNNRTDLHLARLHESVAWGRAMADDTVAGLTQQLSAQISDGDLAALKQLSKVVRRQADVLAFADVFLVLTAMFAGMALFALLMNKPAEVPAEAAGH
jgi:DHA2 family multidrug resistance protein